MPILLLIGCGLLCWWRTSYKPIMTAGFSSFQGQWLLLRFDLQLCSFLMRNIEKVWCWKSLHKKQALCFLGVDMVVNIVTSEICWTTGCRSSMLIDGVLRVWRYYIFSCISNAYEGVILQFVDTNFMLDTSYLCRIATSLYSGILFCTVHRNFYVTWLRTLLLHFIYLCDSELDICQELVNLYLPNFLTVAIPSVPYWRGSIYTNSQELIPAHFTHRIQRDYCWWVPIYAIIHE